MASWPDMYHSYGNYVVHPGDSLSNPLINESTENQNLLTGHARSVAQERRRQENEQFKRLSMLLPVARAISEKHLDKATVVRLAGTYIKLHHAVNPIKLRPMKPLIEVNLIDILDGFVFCLDYGGDILYVSETVSLHLGLSQVDLCGNSIYSYVHPEDASILKRQLIRSQNSELDWFLNIRIKSTLTKRRSKESPKCASGYKVISIEVYRRLDSSFLAFGQPHSVKISNGIKLCQHTVVVNLDDYFRLRYCENWDGILKITHGSSFYDLIHPSDVYIVAEMHRQLSNIGSYRTPIMRIVNYGNTFNAEISAIKYDSNMRDDDTNFRITMIINIINCE
ncbi:unnamed protein product [Bursaphelenchus okinawaensis]|uniref:BHLH domain-containing protein n=1 Tax=Bursaphelenchus okinawaensis TaxID=465554 RepID=A0A811LL21_9BILA|nr:unnamed protein product [Bursaphelenchus okinawaensis]CAG9125959.1 unnamed protein product [Bursaphelenchus okinawaensis]